MPDSMLARFPSGLCEPFWILTKNVTPANLIILPRLCGCSPFTENVFETGCAAVDG